MYIRSVGFSILLILILFTALQSGGLASDGSEADLALNILRSEHPSLQSYSVNGKITKLYGTLFGSGSSPVDAAQRFCENNAVIFRADYADLKSLSHLTDGKHTQPLMYNPETGEYKFTLVYYSQQRDGIPVFRSDLRILVRNMPDYPIVLASSQLKDLRQLRTMNKSLARFDLAKAAVISDIPGLTDFTDPESVIWAGYDGIDAEPTHAIAFEGTDNDTEKWLFVTDAESGEILYKENLIIFEDVVGNVSAIATDGIAAAECEDEAPLPMPHISVRLGTTTVYTDTNGDFIIPHEGTSQVVVSSYVEGIYFDVENGSGEGSFTSEPVIPPGPANLVHNEFSSEESLAEMNGYIQANVVRNMVLRYNPQYPTISTQLDFPVVVNLSGGYCPGNAWYDYSSINFCRSGDGYANTAFSTVVHHEYGHHVVAKGGSGQGQYGEGMADIMGVILTDNSGLAYGFYGEDYCSYPLRDADNNMQYPCGGEIHYCGKLLSGCVWSTRNELIANYPDTYIDIIGNLAVNSVLLHTGTQITPQITIDWLTLDDDDANLANGTPHYPEICAGFGAHNMDCPELAPIWFEYPDGLPEIAGPEQETTFRLIVHAGTVNPIDETAEFHFSIDGAAFESGDVVLIGPNEYECTIPGAMCDSEIEWYISAEGDGSGTSFDPQDAPANTYSITVPPTATALFQDNFELDAGWSVYGSASEGIWERGTPAGDGSNGDPVTDFDGSGQCYLTGNLLGESDVDGGVTELISPVIAIAGLDATFSYARWLSNDLGSAPYEDVMTVSVSSDGGSSWYDVETVGPFQQSSSGWYEHEFVITDYVAATDNVRIRFAVSDMGDDSNVEAAVDAFDVTLYECLNYICGDCDSNGNVDIDDVVFLVNYIFAGGQPPDPIESGDADCSGDVDIDDVVYLIQYIFAGGPAPCDTDGDGVLDC